jgi:hypothetical protein
MAPIIPKQRERERFGLIFFIVIEFLNPVEKKRFTSVTINKMRPGCHAPFLLVLIIVKRNTFSVG